MDEMGDKLTCCGAIRSTAFCPECGRQLRTPKGTLFTLLQHCERTAASLVERRQRWLDSHKRAADSLWAKRLTKSIEKWNGWATNLKALIDR